MRKYFVILLALVGACEQAATPTAVSPLGGQSRGVFVNGAVQLSYRLDVPAHSGLVVHARRPVIHRGHDDADHAARVARARVCDFHPKAILV